MIEQNESVVLSDDWFEATIPVTQGPHKLEWVYRKLNKPGVSEDLSAEIEVIQIQGVKSVNKECQVCDKGVSNIDHTMC